MLIATKELLKEAGNLRMHDLSHLLLKFPGVLIPAGRIGRCRMWTLETIELVKQLRAKLLPGRGRPRRPVGQTKS